jgi:hypothetical protein
MSPDGRWWPATVLFYGGSQPAIATDGSTVAVALVRDASRHNPDDKPEVFVRLWSPETSSWSDLTRSIELSQDGAQPDLAFSGRDGSVWVAWSDHTYDTGRPYVARLEAGVVTQAHRCGNFDVAMAPSLAVDAEGNVFVARTDMLARGEEPQVAYAKLPFGGSACISDEGPPAFGARIPSLAIRDSNFCLAWQQELPAGDEIVLGCRSGGAWIAPNLSNSPGRSVLPRLALDPVMGSMVVWSELGPPSSVAFRQNVPPPSIAEAVTDPGADSSNPDLAYRRGVVHAVWSERRDAGLADVRYARWSVAPPTPTPTATVTPTDSPPEDTPTPGSTTETPPAPRWYVWIPFSSTP